MYFFIYDKIFKVRKIGIKVTVRKVDFQRSSLRTFVDIISYFIN